MERQHLVFMAHISGANPKRGAKSVASARSANLVDFGSYFSQLSHRNADAVRVIVRQLLDLMDRTRSIMGFLNLFEILYKSLFCLSTSH